MIFTSKSIDTQNFDQFHNSKVLRSQYLMQSDVKMLTMSDQANSNSLRKFKNGRDVLAARFNFKIGNVINGAPRRTFNRDEKRLASLGNRHSSSKVLNLTFGLGVADTTSRCGANQRTINTGQERTAEKQTGNPFSRSEFVIEA